MRIVPLVKTVVLNVLLAAHLAIFTALTVLLTARTANQIIMGRIPIEHAQLALQTALSALVQLAALTVVMEL